MLIACVFFLKVCNLCKQKRVYSLFHICRQKPVCTLLMFICANVCYPAVLGLIVIVVETFASVVKRLKVFT